MFSKPRFKNCAVMLNLLLRALFNRMRVIYFYLTHRSLIAFIFPLMFVRFFASPY